MHDPSAIGQHARATLAGIVPQTFAASIGNRRAFFRRHPQYQHGDVRSTMGISKMTSAAASNRARETLRDPAIWAWLLVALLAILPAKAALAQNADEPVPRAGDPGRAPAPAKPRIEKAADLPRFSYRIEGSVEDVIRDDAKFRRFATEVRRDAESVLAGYQIDDRATLRQLEGELAQLDYLDANYDAALRRAARLKELQDKPADKLMSGLQLRAMIAAQRKIGDWASDAYRAETGRLIAADLAQM